MALDTSTDIVNRALSLNGIKAIDDIDDNTPEAKECKALYEPARRNYLRIAGPSFARQEASLSIASGQTSSIFTYVYAYPADCIMSREIINTTGRSGRVSYKKGTHSSLTSSVILTNKASAVLEYTVDITTLTAYSDDDKDALVTYLAMKIAASPINYDPELEKQFETKFLGLLQITNINDVLDENFKFYDKRAFTASALTATDVANRALRHQGIDPIDAITDKTSDEAIACNEQYAGVFEEYLKDASLGRTRKEITLSTASGQTSSIYAYVYEYPSDCLIVREIYNPAGRSGRIVFETGAHSSTDEKLILTDQVTAVLIYTKNITDLSKLREEDINAMSLLLASKVGAVVPKDRDENIRAQFVIKSQQDYQVALEKARANDEQDQNAEFYDNRTFTESALTTTDIANKALRRLGILPIDSITDKTTDEAIQCNEEYLTTLNEYLIQANPNFAREEVALTLDSGEESDIWSFIYEYPSDCINIRYIYNPSGTSEKVEYELGIDDAGVATTIMTNLEDAIIVYTKAVTDLSLFKVHDTTAISYLLASKVGLVVPKETEMAIKSQLVDRAENNYRVALATAITINKREQHKDEPLYDRLKGSRR